MKFIILILFLSIFLVGCSNVNPDNFYQFNYSSNLSCIGENGVGSSFNKIPCCNGLKKDYDLCDYGEAFCIDNAPFVCLG